MYNITATLTINGKSRNGSFKTRSGALVWGVNAVIDHGFNQLIRTESGGIEEYTFLNGPTTHTSEDVAFMVVYEAKGI